jgi:hypothetical protein
LGIFCALVGFAFFGVLVLAGLPLVDPLLLMLMNRKARSHFFLGERLLYCAASSSSSSDSASSAGNISTSLIASRSALMPKYNVPL